MIGPMEGRIRFEKALESGPPFCSVHIRQVENTVRAERFAQIEHKKVEAMIAQIGQSRLRGGADLKRLIAEAISYLGAVEGESAGSPSLDADYCAADMDQLAADVAREFAGWDEAKRAVHLNNIESELASLRYRNSVLSEENRRLRLAHTASEAMRQDLERDRKELLAAVKDHDSTTTPEKR